MNLDPATLALRVVNHISAMVAFIDSEERYVFANDAYLHWFGRTPAQVVGMPVKDMLGPLYEMNKAHIQAALQGEKRVFERRIPVPGVEGAARDSLVTYTPEISDGKVQGFSVHVTDVSVLREREAALKQALAERDLAVAEVRVLSGLLPICSHCKGIRDSRGAWHPVERYVSEHSDARFSHSICPTCMGLYYQDEEPARA